MTARSLDDLPRNGSAIGVDANCFDFVIEGDRGFHFLYQMSVSNLVLPKISETAIASLANLANSRDRPSSDRGASPTIFALDQFSDLTFFIGYAIAFLDRVARSALGANQRLILNSA